MKFILKPMFPVSALLLGLSLACGGPESTGSAKGEGPVAPPQPKSAQAASPPPATPAPIPAKVAPTTSEPTGSVQSDAQEKNARGPLLVKRLVVTNRVVDREPEPLMDPLANEAMLAFILAKNESKDEGVLVVTFEHESGKTVGHVELKVPAEMGRYRTWARTHNIKESGKWTAVVRDKSGQELSRQEFSVGAS